MKRCHYKTRAEFGRWKCEKCGSIFLTRALLYEHMHKENHMKGNLYNKNGTAWNKGLTKETSAILREQSERLKKAI